MFAIIVPAAVAPITITLYWAQHRAKKLGVVATNINDATGEVDAPRIVSNQPFLLKFWNFLIDMDALGLLIFAAGWACLLVPWVESNHLDFAKDWKLFYALASLSLMVPTQPGIRLVSLPCLSAVASFLSGLSPTKLMSPKYRCSLWHSSRTRLFCFRRSLGSLILCRSTFNTRTSTASFSSQETGARSTKSELLQMTFHINYWFSITFNFSYFAYTQTLALTVFGILTGFVQAYTRRTKVRFPASCL